jgi:hypothetical protein
VAKNLKSVEGLDLRRCGLVTDVGLASLAGLGSLRILNLDHCAQITDKVRNTLTHFISRNPMHLFSFLSFTIRAPLDPIARRALTL